MLNKNLLKKATEILLEAIGVDKIDKTILNETPKRVARSWIELLDGYNTDEISLYKTFESKSNNLVIVKNIDFVSICEHHLLSFSGKISIGYIPKNKVLGLSKFARIVDCFAKRLQLQERLVDDIGNSIIKNLDIEHLFIVAEASHSCFSCRGAKQKNSSTLTFFTYGKFDEYRETELLKLLE